MDRQKLVQKFHSEDVAHKKNMGVKSTAKYRRKQRALKALETKKYQASKVAASGRSNEVKVYTL